MEIDLLYLNVIVGTLIPLLVGAVTKMRASGGLKAIFNAGLSAILGYLTASLAACQGDVCVLGGREAIVAAGVTWITSVATYYGLWKPTGTAGTVQSSTNRFGVGKERDE